MWRRRRGAPANRLATQVLLVVADRLDVARSAEVEAAREVIVRTAKHAQACSVCARLDAAFLAEVGEALAVVSDADLDAAAVELARELRLTTHQEGTATMPAPPSTRARGRARPPPPPSCGCSARSVGISPLRTSLSSSAPRPAARSWSTSTRVAGTPSTGCPPTSCCASTRAESRSGGREDPREVWERRMSQTRARTLLVSELANYDLSASVKAEILAGTRLLADVLDEHDRKNAPQRKDES